MEAESADVLIIGSGAAGLRAAIELSEASIDVLVLGKCKLREAHTKAAQGGINAALKNMDPEDSWQLHAADTIHDGGMINDSEAVEILCQHAPDAVKELEEWGADFAKDENGKILQRFFGAATYRRACFIGAHTGLAILNALVDQTLQRNIRFRSEVYVFSLLMNQGVVNGAIGLDIAKGKIVVFHAKIVVLATGGHSRMFARSSSHFWENNGDGIALAHSVGASFMDMEMFQFHPTGMVYPEKAAGLLVTEATRGDGGILTNKDGERFMKKYDPKRMELSARDVVTRAIWKEIEEGRGTAHGGVYLDISHKSKAYIMERIPDMYEKLKKWNSVDISKEKMEVAPTAHYSMGGVLVDHHTGKVLGSNKPIAGLYAVGEITSGIHGGNRLGGNSLAEVMVFGKLTGQSIAKALLNAKDVPIDEEQAKTVARVRLPARSSKEGRDPIEAKKDIQKLMWNGVGVIRDQKTMESALGSLDSFRDLTFAIGSDLQSNENLIAALDVHNMIPTCEMIIRSALMREESRAAHTRRDFPETKEKWKVNIVCSLGDTGLQLAKKEVPPIPGEIEQHLKGRKTQKIHLLE